MWLGVHIRKLVGDQCSVDIVQYQAMLLLIMNFVSYCLQFAP